MAIRRKGAAPWSVDYEAGLADAPVSSHPGVEADQVNPVIDAGFIDEKGIGKSIKYQRLKFYLSRISGSYSCRR